MRFKGLDLNLFVALDVLLDEQSVSRAAERLNVSQPAMSAALTRLRDYFGDPLLVLHGKRMIPTAHAMRMKPRLEELLLSTDALVSATTHFDPAISQRQFRVGASDYVLTVLFPQFTAMLSRIAPNVTIDCVQPSDAMLPMLDQGSLDLTISPEEHLATKHPSELLFEERHVVVGCGKNPMFKSGNISTDDFYAAGHIIVEIGSLKPGSFAETHMPAIGPLRRIEMQVTSFLVAPELVINTNNLTVMHERLARHYASRLDLAIAPLPFDFPIMKEMIQYHSTRSDDLGLRWFIEQLKEVANLPISKIDKTI